MNVLWSRDLSAHRLSDEISQSIQIVQMSDENLADGTASLSISTREEILARMKAFVEWQKVESREAILASILFDDEDADTDEKEERLWNVIAERKRRLSSQQGVIQPEKKAPKPHKRKLKKNNESLEIYITLDPEMTHVHVKHLSRFVNGLVLNQKQANLQVLHGTGLNLVAKIVFVFVSGVNETDFEAEVATDGSSIHTIKESTSKLMPFLHQEFRGYLRIRFYPDSDSAMTKQEVFQSPLTPRERKQRKRQARKQITLPDLMLTLDQLREHAYPIHSSSLRSLNEEAHALKGDWLETKSFSHTGLHTFALDCEFCQTPTGKMLARVSLVNFQGEVVYDSYVKPQSEITDYLTKYSGITKEDMDNATTTFDEARSKLLEVIAEEDILIGHSLDCDLRVLKIKHPRVIDTALIYDSERGRSFKPGLRTLASTYLGRKIQQGEVDGTGHSSVEDLLACLDLVKLKLIEGPSFGRNDRFHLIFERLELNDSPEQVLLIDERPQVYAADLNHSNAIVVTAEDDDAALDAFMNAEIPRLSIIGFNSLLRLTDSVEVSRADKLADLDVRLEDIYEKLPSNSVFIVSSDGGSRKRLNELMKVRRLFQKSQQDVSEMKAEDIWDNEKDIEMVAARDSASSGVLFIKVKK